MSAVSPSTVSTVSTAAKPSPRPIAMRAYQDALLNACDPDDPSKGVRESGGNNRGQAVELYLSMVGLGPGNPWCAAFVVARFLLAVARLTQQGVSVKLPASFPKTGACSVLKAWAKRLKIWHSVADVRAGKYTPRPGDIVIFDWDDEPGNDHTGICRGWDSSDKAVLTVEGNTTPVAGVSRESNTGDGVWKKARSLGSLGVGGGVIEINF